MYICTYTKYYKNFVLTLRELAVWVTLFEITCTVWSFSSSGVPSGYCNGEELLSDSFGRKN